MSSAQRKLKKQERLSAWESDRVARLLLLFKEAKAYFGDYGRAAEWMRRPLAGLDGDITLGCLETQPGYDRVRDILVRMGTGVTA